SPGCARNPGLKPILRWGNLFPGTRTPTQAHRSVVMPQATAIKTSVAERFLRYVTYDTQSDEKSQSYPSTAKQLVLLDQLAEELRAVGLADATRDEHGYVFATIPATTRKRGVRTIGLVAHVDTSPEMSGAGVKPIVQRGWRGQDIGGPGGRGAGRGLLRIHQGQRPAPSDGRRDLLGARADRDRPRLQHPSRVRQGQDGERDQGRRRLRQSPSREQSLPRDHERARGLRPSLR